MSDPRSVAATVRRLISVCVLVLGPAAVSAQQSDTAHATAPIQDNSFLVEEAYNQGSGVVQHISTYARLIGSNRWSYAFTQEWPLGGVRHQLSFTLPVTAVDDIRGGGAGVGDIAVNYRYQLIGDAETTVAFAPRITTLLSSGSAARGLGAGGHGLQVNLPLSIVLPGSLVVHSNAGATYTRRAHDSVGQEAAATGYNLGQSVIWLLHPRLNFMLEAAWTQTEDVVGPRQTERRTALLLSPGLRGAISFASGLQIVPGIAIPFGVGPSRGERNVFVYLSFEHPFAKPAP